MNSKYKITINKYLAPILVKIYISIFNAYNASVIKAFLIVNQNLSFIRRVISEIQSWQYSVMYRKLLFTFWILEVKMPVLDLKWMWQMLETVYLCLKQIKREKSAWKRNFTALCNQCKQNRSCALFTWERIVSSVACLPYNSSTDTQIFIDH